MGSIFGLVLSAALFTAQTVVAAEDATVQKAEAKAEAAEKKAEEAKEAVKEAKAEAKAAAEAKEDAASNGNAISKCLAAWGEHPFGKNPKYKTLSTSVRVFGIGGSPKDAEITKTPALVLVNPAVNVMGGTTYELLNPNGWYCFRANVNVMGGLVVKAHCKAHLASASSGATVMGKNESDSKGVTVMGSTKVKLVDCE